MKEVVLSRWLSLFPSSNQFFFPIFFFNVKSLRHKKNMMMKEFKEKFCVIIFSGDREVQRFHEMTKETNGLGGKKVANRNV